jgi:hypothetical protein
MGHQINYHLASADIIELEKRLRKIQPLTILHSRSPSAKPRIVESFDVVENGKPWPHLFLVRSEDISDVLLEEVRAQGYWAVDELRSPVIQLNKGFLEAQVLRSGRLYYVDGFWGPDKTWVEKPEPFRKWAKSVLSATKKMLKRRDMYYIGPAAEAWLAATGGQLVL